jgi:ribosomal protein S12 methylthiotransferase accessory factor
LPAGDVRREIAVLIERLAQRGHQVIAVDCTPRLLDRLGLFVVKLLIPGLLPLTAGHRNRILGGRRLFEAPGRMGAQPCASTVAELNPWPHPFW